MAVDIAPQTELATYTGLYHFASTAAAVLGPFLAGLLIDALGKDYGAIFLIAPIALAFAFVFMLGVRRGESVAEAAPADQGHRPQAKERGGQTLSFFVFRQFDLTRI